MKSTVLVIDDEPLNLSVLSSLLTPEYRVLGARSGAVGLSLAAAEAPDLIMLDVMMPGMNGYDVLRGLKEDRRTAGVPVIFVSALGAEPEEEYGLALGAVDYIVKPFKPAIVQARVRTHLALKAAQDRLTSHNADLEREVEQRMQESLITQDLTLVAMAELAETRDSETGYHIQRTQLYVEALARHLVAAGPFGARLDEAEARRIVKAAPLHDIGKIGIPDHILLKPGPLTPAEYEAMKVHSQIGSDVIGRVVVKATSMHASLARAAGREPDPAVTPETIRFLATAQVIALHHHERWDGSGYPHGLVGDAIPLPARLMALADVFDALTARRIYKTPWALDDAIPFIVSQAATQFDPDVTAAFWAVRDEFRAIHQRNDGG